MPSSFWDTKKPIAIAHRGGALAYGKDKYRAENTLPVFEATAKLGYKYMEMDVIATKDNEVVAIHVAKNRIEAKSRDNKELPDYSRLQEMTYDELKNFTERDIPKLAQILESLPEIKFLVDAKTDRVVEPLAKVILEHSAQHKVIVGSFYPRRVIKLHRLIGSAGNYRLIISRSPIQLASQLRSVRRLDFISAVDLPLMYLNKRAVKWLHGRGLKILVWTPNSRSQMLSAMRKGADGIISDNATLLMQVINEKR
jgi:glycerophosphoryl diester phosphodiesterase